MKPTHRKLAVAAGTTLLSLPLVMTTAAATSAQPAALVAAGDECPAGRGTLTIGDTGEFRGFDPLITSTVSATTGASTVAAVYDALMYFNPDTGEFEPWVAESLEHDEALVEWTIRLREGISFGNGDPLTADAVKATIERNQSDQNVTATKASALRIAEVAVVDELTVVLTMAEPNGGVPAMLATGVGMITNPAVVDSVSAEEFNLGVPGAGVGAFEPERFAPGEEVVLTGKSDYWGGPVCLGEVRWVGVGDQDSRVDAFMFEEFDVVQLRDGYTHIEERIKPAELGIYSEVRSASGAVFMDGDLDVRLRRAVAHAVDPVSIDMRVNNGYGLPEAAIMHPESSLYSGAQGLPHDPDLARELVTEVAADGEWDGRVSLMCTDIAGDACIVIEGALISVGFEVDVQTETVRGVIDMFSRGGMETDLLTWSFSMGDQRAHEALELNLRRIGQGDDEVFSELLDQLERTADPTAQREIIAAMQERWNEVVPTANFAAASQSWAWQPRVHGLSFSMAAIIRLDGAWVD